MKLSRLGSALATAALGGVLLLCHRAAGQKARAAPLTIAPRGARVLFTTYEAESGENHVHGKVVQMTGLPRGDASAPEKAVRQRSQTRVPRHVDRQLAAGGNALTALVNGYHLREIDTFT